MKTVYFLNHAGDCGEVEGMFDENGELISSCACNDAMWRNEYFSGFMKTLGIEVSSIPDHMEAAAIAKLEAEYADQVLDEDEQD